MARGARPRVQTIGGGRGDRRRTLWVGLGCEAPASAVVAGRSKSWDKAVEGGRLRQRMVAEADPVGDLSGDSRRR